MKALLAQTSLSKTTSLLEEFMQVLLFQDINAMTLQTVRSKEMSLIQSEDLTWDMVSLCTMMSLIHHLPLALNLATMLLTRTYGTVSTSISRP